MGSLDVTVFAIVTILALAFYFVKKRYSSWKELGVPYEEPVFPFGNIKGIGKEFHSHQIMKRIYNKCKASGAPFCGMYFYLTPLVLALTTDFVKTVLVKDSAVFCDRGNYYNEDDGK
jgi:cytochrome P450 family 6